MKFTFGLAALVAFGLVTTLTTVTPSLAASSASGSPMTLVWPKPAVASLQARLGQGACFDSVGNRLLADICRVNGVTDTKKKPLRSVLSQPSPPVLQIEVAGQVIRLERTNDEREFLINSTKLDIGIAKTQGELHRLIHKALQKKTVMRNPWIGNPWINSAVADGIVAPETSAMIQMLIVETHQLGNCDLFLAFGKKCVDAMKLVDLKIKAGAKELKEINAELNVFRKRMEGSVIPSIEGYDAGRACAVRVKAANIDETAQHAESSMKECREMVTRNTRGSGGIVESENIFVAMFGMFFGTQQETAGTVRARPSADSLDVGEGNR